MSENRVIGKDNKIPWHIKDDLIHLRNLTKNQIVIVGRKTYDSMVTYYDKSGNPMPGRLYIVVTRDKNYKPTRTNTAISDSIDEAIKLAKGEAEKEVFIIGGQLIFEQTIDKVDKLYITLVEGNFEGDAFFPDYSDFKTLVSEQKGESEGYKYTFLELER